MVYDLHDVTFIHIHSSVNTFSLAPLRAFFKAISASARRFAIISHCICISRF